MTNNKPLPPRKRLVELFTYDPETGHLIRRVDCGPVSAGSRAGSLGSDGYRYVRVDGIKYLEHRIIFRICTGIDAGDFEVDHDNRNKSDNRIANLRLATRKQQLANQSGVAGCCYRSALKQWQAIITIDGATKHLGLWLTEEIARAVYATEAAKVHGEFAPDPPPNPFGFKNVHWGKCADGSHKGVSFNKHKSKWQAYIRISGKKKHLGYFPTQAEAREARLAAEDELSKATS